MPQSFSTQINKGLVKPNMSASTQPIAPISSRDVMGNLPLSTPKNVGQIPSITQAPVFQKTQGLVSPTEPKPAQQQIQQPIQQPVQSPAQQPIQQPAQQPTQPLGPTYGGLVGTLATTAAGPTPEFKAAQQEYTSAASDLAKLREEQAQQSANILGGRTNLAEAGGEQGLMQSLAAGKEAAITGRMQAAQLAMQTATGQQQTQQQGLGAAAGLAAPQPYGITTTPYQPVTGTFGTMPGGTSGAFGAGQVAENVNIGGQYQQASTAANVAKGYEDTIKNYMIQNNLNPSDLTVANGVIQWLKGEVGDPKYQTLANYINEYSTNAATALGISGGNVTDFRLGIAQSLLNPKASAQSMSEVLTNNAKAIQDKLANMKSTATGGGQVAGGTPGYQPAQQGGNIYGNFFGNK